MEHIFYSLHDFMLSTKTTTYIFMGLIVLAVWGFYLFITGRDEKIKKF